MTFISTSEKTKAIKSALTKIYGKGNVGVRKGTGTGSGWIHINVTVSPEAIAERKSQQEISNKVREIARAALKEIGAAFYTYTSDDGYNSENECVLIQIEAKEQGIPMANMRDFDRAMAR